jgi:biopolymer transport protein ExbD
MNRRHRRKRSYRELATGQSGIRLTSMMDILTTLLLFLLKSFVAETDVVSPPPDVALPVSTSEDPPQSSLVVAISEDLILLGGAPVVSVENALAGESLFIPRLGEELDQTLARMDDLARRRGAEEMANLVTIHGDRDVAFELLERVMFTCNSVGVERLALAVVQES